MVQRLTGKDPVSASQLARETGLRQQNLSRWLQEARSLPVTYVSRPHTLKVMGREGFGPSTYGLRVRRIRFLWVESRRSATSFPSSIPSRVRNRTDPERRFDSGGFSVA